MGQYYHPTIIDSRGHVHYLYSHEYGNGLKLMEHSYLGNDFVNAVLTQILFRPNRVAWMGDYALDDWNGNEPYQQAIHKAKFQKAWDRVYGDDEKCDKRKIHPEPLSGFDEPRKFVGWYLANHTKKTYVDLGKFFEANKWHESWKDWRTGETGEGDMCVHPLPLLTACGNGRGGGDYYAEYPDYDKVGIWAFDLIEFTNELPAGYEEAEYHFKEEA